MFSFPFLFPSYCYCVVHRVLSFVSCGCNESSFVFLYIDWVVVSMHLRCLQCCWVLFLPLFLKHIVCQRRLCDVMLYESKLVFLFFCPFVKCPEYLTSGTVQVFIPLIRFMLLSFVSNSFLVLLRYSFWMFSFISICLMVSASKMPEYL